MSQQAPRQQRKQRHQRRRSARPDAPDRKSKRQPVKADAAPSDRPRSGQKPRSPIFDADRHQPSRSRDVLSPVYDPSGPTAPINSTPYSTPSPAMHAGQDNAARAQVHPRSNDPKCNSPSSRMAAPDSNRRTPTGHVRTTMKRHRLSKTQRRWPSFAMPRCALGGKPRRARRRKGKSGRVQQRCRMSATPSPTRPCPPDTRVSTPQDDRPTHGLELNSGTQAGTDAAPTRGTADRTQRRSPQRPPQGTTLS